MRRRPAGKEDEAVRAAVKKDPSRRSQTKTDLVAAEALQCTNHSISMKAGKTSSFCVNEAGLVLRLATSPDFAYVRARDKT